MNFESHPIQFAPLEISQQGANYRLSHGNDHLLIDQQQYRIFENLNAGMSVHQLVFHFLKMGWIISFQQIYQLLNSLCEKNFIRSKNLITAFSNWQSEDEPSGMLIILRVWF